MEHKLTRSQVEIATLVNEHDIKRSVELRQNGAHVIVSSSPICQADALRVK